MAARVLIVDDTESIRTMLRMRLEHEGAVVVAEAVDGADGVKKAQLLRPDVVIMDYDMPVMNGVEATREVVRLAPGVRVVGYSSSSVESNIKMAAAGAAATFEKSQFNELVDFVKSL